MPHLVDTARALVAAEKACYETERVRRDALMRFRSALWPLGGVPPQELGECLDRARDIIDIVALHEKQVEAGAPDA